MRQVGLYGRRGVVLGRLGRRLLYDNSETHVLLVAPTRSGKGTGVIIPTLLSWPASAIILDPKDGENYDVTAPWRARCRQSDRLLYPVPHAPCLYQCAGHDPRGAAQRGGRYADRCAQSGGPREDGAGVGHESPLPGAGGPGADGEYAACEVHGAGGLPGAGVGLPHAAAPHLGRVPEDLTTTAHHAAGVHQAIATLTTALSNITRGPRTEQRLDDGHPAAGALQRSAHCAEYGHLDVCAGGFPVRRQRPDPVPGGAVPPGAHRLHPLYRVVLDVAMARLMEHKVRTWQHRLLLCADELPAHGYIHAIDQGAADMAGYGMKGLFVAQDIEQVEEVYGEKNNLWGNTEIKVFHAPTNDLTARRIADRLMGEGTVSNPTEQHQGGLLGRRSTSYGHVGRAMVTHDEMMELPAHLQIIRMKGLKPILATKIDYRTDHAFAGKAA